MDVTEDGPLKFAVGQVIHHRRYEYRGVIVAADRQCEADKDWYKSNQTQPRRDQPWYHVLVHDAPHTTYVAQENLEPDPTGQPIRHAHLNRFFRGFLKGRYYAEALN